MKNRKTTESGDDLFQMKQLTPNEKAMKCLAQNILRYSTGKHFFLTLSSNKFSCHHDAFTDHGSGCLILRKRRLNESFSIPGYKFGKTSNRQEGFSTNTLLLLQIMCRKYILALSRILKTSFARIIQKKLQQNPITNNCLF